MSGSALQPRSEKELFAQYVAVCNRALETHKDEFPYKQLWEMAQVALEKQPVSLAIYDDQLKAVYDVLLHDNHLNIVAESHAQPSHVWHMNRHYLEQVVNNPDDYINNPAKIDWEWLKASVD